MSTNIFVVGLDELNHEILRRIPGAEDYRFHQMLTFEELQGGTVSVPDLLAKAEHQLDHFEGEIHAIVGYWDFPSTLLVPILCERRGVTSAPLAAVVKSEHKYWSRLVQSNAIAEFPGFGLIDLDDDEPTLPSHMSYPVWIKPIESHSSEGAHYVEDEQRLGEALELERETVGRLAGPFRELLENFDFPDDIVAVTDRTCLVEEAASGHQMTVEGFCRNGEAVTYGVVDSITYDEAPSFLRYQYPASRVSQAVQDHMCDVARRVMVAIGLDNSTFNIEFFWDSQTETLTLLEINARHSQSHALIFEHVDGLPNHAYMLDLALGREPVLQSGQGRYAVAAKWFVRSFTDGVVAHVPSASDIDTCEQQVDGVRVHVVVDDGERLSASYGHDSYSYVLAEIFIGADDESDLAGKYERCLEALPFAIDEVDDDADTDA